jgi:hypothetical protein
MYGIQYILYPDNHFESKFVHCTGIDYGRGTYDQRWRKMVFTFDSIPPQQLSITCINNSPSDSLQIIALNAYDSSQCMTCYYMVKDELIRTDSNQFSLGVFQDTLNIKCAGQSVQTLILDSPACSVYELYLPSVWVTYSSPGELLLQRESKNLYSQTYFNRDENKEKPWKKGKKRKGKNYYALIKKEN